MKLSRRQFVGSVAGMAAAAALSQTMAQTAPSTPPTTVPANPDPRLDWWRQAKFGMFIHWGLYCIPAGVWKGQEIRGIGEWIMNRAKIPVKEYEKLAEQFNPVKFNADEWVQIAKDAGQKYMVITSKHHDGFAMYHSLASKYNVVDATPFKRDVCKELADACARNDMRLGFYYSQAQDWHEPNGIGNTWDFGPDDKKDFDEYFNGKAIPQVREILTGYGPVCLVWFDTPKNVMTEERSMKLKNVVHELQPACLIDGRIGKAGADYQSTGDNKIPDAVKPGDWETPATLNDTWGFKTNDNNWKSANQLIFNLVDIVSKGGNYLLNVGPTSEGLIPQPSVERLRAMGAWLKTNGDAIYGAKPTPYGPELKSKDWRCTTKGGTQYLHVFNWPKDGQLVLPKSQMTPGRAHMMSDPGKSALTILNDNGQLVIKLPDAAPDPVATVIAIEM